MQSQIGDELYALPPSAFTAARDSQVAQARKDGDKALAAEVAALKRPTQAGWLVNLLALHRPDVVADLIELGGTIRAAQGSVPPTQLRDLSAQRRKALDAALAETTHLARAAGQPAPSRAQLDGVEATLAAAMADDDAAAQVRAGRVLKSLHYSGFGDAFGATAIGPSASSRAAAPSGTAPPRTGQSRTALPRTATKAPKADEEAALRAEAEARRAAAEQRLAEAEAALDTAAATERAANADVERLTDELAALRESLEHAQLAARQARQTRQAAERDLESAHRRLRAAAP
jgi:hypothetical protein